MAFHYRRGKVFWISYTDNSGKRVREPLKTEDGWPVKEEKVARYLTRERQNKLERSHYPIKPKNSLVLDVLEEYRLSSSGIKAPRTIVNDCGAIKEFLVRTDIKSLPDVSESILRQYLNTRIDKKEIVQRTANHIIRYVHAFLNYCVRHTYLQDNPIKGMKKFKIAKTSPRFLSKTEIKKILSVSRKETLYPAIATAIYTGMRLGEIRRLQWADIKAGVVMVEKSKTGKFRAIPIHPQLRKILKPNLLPFDFSNNRRIFKRIKKKSGMPDIGWHKFRHTFASQLAQSGVDIYKIGKYLGHASVSTTEIYAHLVPDHDDIAKLKF